MLNITADENIAFAEEAFSSLGKVTLFPGREISNTILRDTDILIVRSVTRVDKKLLEHSRVRFIGTATIGTDHIDLEYLKNKHIHFADAKGCNAQAVVEYVFTALYRTAAEKRISLRSSSIGIVGVGNIGSRVARIAESIGMKVILNDPPLKRLTGDSNYRELKDILETDIITLHVPLTYNGIDKTFHLFDEDILRHLKENSILINSSRGEVVDNNALAKLNKSLTIIMDVWEKEPDINRELLKKVFLATPHIAGYTLEGKINGTLMIYKALCNYLGTSPVWQPDYPPVDDPVISIAAENAEEDAVDKILSKVYDIKRDDADIRRIITLEDNKAGNYFDNLRKDYPLRREFKNYSIRDIQKSSTKEVLKSLGFILSSD